MSPHRFLALCLCGGWALSSLVVSHAGQKPQPAPFEITEIQIDGGYGYLRCLSLIKDGRYEWSGYEPPRQSYSQKKGRLDAKETKRIWALAETVHREVRTNAVEGGERSCKLVLVSSKGKREISIKSSAKDQRSPTLKELMEALYKTSNAAGKEAPRVSLSPRQEAMLRRVMELLKESGHWYPDYPLTETKFDAGRRQWMFLFSGPYVDAGVAGFISDENTERIDILLFPPMWTKYERKAIKK